MTAIPPRLLERFLMVQNQMAALPLPPGRPTLRSPPAREIEWVCVSKVDAKHKPICLKLLSEISSVTNVREIRVQREGKTGVKFVGQNFTKTLPQFAQTIQTSDLAAFQS